MEWIAGILFLLYGLYRSDLSLYEFDEPVILYREPKDTTFELMLLHSNYLLRKLKEHEMELL